MTLKNLNEHNQTQRKRFNKESESKQRPPKKNGFECPHCKKELFDITDEKIKFEMKKQREAGALVKQPVKCSCGYNNFRYL